jgi:hypothetical protein
MTKIFMKKINKKLIAPCGMNCGVCMAYLREKNHCDGCKAGPTSVSCLRCKIRNCTERKGQYCFDCEKFPCDSLKHLDKRYRTKYEMSEIENLEFIRDNGIDEFVEKENARWVSDKGVYCVHKKEYFKQEK